MRWLACFTLLALCGCEPEGGSAGMNDAGATERARAAAKAAFERLSGELGKAMGDGGPVGAIEVCSEMAGPLTAEVAAEHGVSLTRLSDRARNPGQQAEGADLEALNSFREAMAAGEEASPRVSRDDEGTAVVHLPIVLNNALCLQCHGGEEVAAATRSKLNELYPGDKATGYALGDLRGVWRVEVPPAR
ncbi:MAG: DUF3365 domain-containing protein [Verrucomicrobiales bacterium]